MEMIIACVYTVICTTAMGFVILDEAMRKLMSGLHLSKV